MGIFASAKEPVNYTLNLRINSGIKKLSLIKYILADQPQHTFVNMNQNPLIHVQINEKEFNCESTL